MGGFDFLLKIGALFWGEAYFREGGLPFRGFYTLTCPHNSNPKWRVFTHVVVQNPEHVFKLRKVLFNKKILTNNVGG